MSNQTIAERETLIKSNLEAMLPGNTFTVRLSEDDTTGKHIDLEWTGRAKEKQVKKWLNEMSAVGDWLFDNPEWKAAR